MRSLHRLRLEDDIDDVDELAVELGALLGPQRLHRRHVLVGYPTPALERHSHGGELGRRHTDAEREHHATAREHVQRGDGLGQGDGVVVRQDDDTRN